MDRTIAVFHNGSLAHYTVTRQNNGSLKAYLLNNHDRNAAPPPFLLIQKEGNHWTNQHGHSEIADYIGQVFENQYENSAPFQHSYV